MDSFYKINACLIIIFLFSAAIINGYPGGISGYTLKSNVSGCGACHSTHNGASSLVQVLIDGPSTLLPGETGNFNVTISGGNGNDVGIDIAVSAGNLAKVDNYLKLSSGELVHSTPKNYSGGSYTYHFDYTAPSVSGEVTLYVTGMSSRQQWNFMQNFYIEVGGTLISSNIQLDEGWNIISVPVTASDMSSVNIFPDAISSTFGFDGVYEVITVIENGKGYWVKYPQTANINLSGADANENIPVTPGWNLIGAFHENINLGNISTIPEGIISSQFFEFNNGYLPTSVLTPGKGYWVNVSQAGSILLDGTINAKTESINYSNLAGIDIRDARGSKTTLYITEKDGYSAAAMPPVPPAGVFDARFDDNTFISRIENGRNIIIKDADYPVVIVCNDKYNYYNGATGEYISSGDRIVLENQGVSNIMIESVGLPVSFKVSQNYPNPFNPSTSINVQIPQKTELIISVYNIGGELVGHIFEGLVEEGVYNYEFNGTNLSSGVYICRVKSCTVNGEINISTVKMTLLK